MTDIWAWIQDSIYEDEACYNWFLEWRRALDLDESDPVSAVAMLDSTIASAANARNAWWKLFLEHWKLQILLNKSRDFKAALDCAARCTIEVRQSQFDAFPQRVCLHEDLINCYHGLDPRGYAPLIEKALDYMEGEISPGMECEMCHLGLRAQFYLSAGKPEATQAAQTYLERTQSLNHEFHGAQAYLQFCHTLVESLGTDAKEALEENSALGLDLVKRANYGEGLHEALMWRALATRWNHAPEAGRIYQSALQARSRYGAAARPGYYYAGVLFQEADGNYEGAVRMLDAELSEVEGHSEFWREVSRRLKKCELLSFMGLPWEEEAEKLRLVARNLKDSESVERKLLELNTGKLGE